METEFRITRASRKHLIHIDAICRLMAESARVRGTGIGGRSSADLRQKVLDGKAIIATQPNGQWVGFAYLDVWQGGRFVSQSGLIVNPAYRRMGIATHIKYALFRLSRRLFPRAKIFSITTNQAVMNVNTQLGFRPVAFAELPQEARFWGQCASCQNCDILARTGREYCLCTGMLYEPSPTKLVTLPYAKTR